MPFCFNKQNERRISLQLKQPQQQQKIYLE